MSLYRLLKPVLFQLDPEQAHHLAVGAFTRICAVPGVAPLLTWLNQVQDPVCLMGLTFPNRVGLAAGFDKQARFIGAAAALGFGHIEVGAVTPKPQSGHPRPRLFRHPEIGALRNRMGFNNDGAVAIGKRLAGLDRRPIPVGVNLGKGSQTPLNQAWRDYQQTLELLYPWADFFVVNVSSPNTAGLRDLQGESLAEILQALGASNRRLSQTLELRPRPLLVKLSPDLSDPALEEVAVVAREHGADGLVAVNTTIRREGNLAGVSQVGGVSGAPLRERAVEVIARLRGCLGPDFPLIGVGGIMDPADALALRAAGADLVQVYSGLIYAGPSLPRRLAEGLRRGR